MEDHTPPRLPDVHTFGSRTHFVPPLADVGSAEFADINRSITAIGEAMGQKVGCHSVSGLQHPEISRRTVTQTQATIPKLI